MENLWIWIVVAIVVILFITLIFMVNIGLWIRALFSGVYVSMGELISINVKNLNAKHIVDNYIKARKSGVTITVTQIQNHVQAKGDVDSVINALIASHNARIDLPVPTAMAIDLAGRNIVDAVRHCITPQVVELGRVTAVAKNGVEISVRAKVTLRVNLKKIVGGALEETIVARVSERIVTAIGNAEDHIYLLQNPRTITAEIMADGAIASDTAFDILSVDIFDVEIGRNVGAELEVDRAEAVKYISQADSEKRRSEALAAEQEMRALTQEMRAKVVAAESEVPAALANALRQGNIGVSEYLRLENIKGDTAMRKMIGGVSEADMVTPPTPKKKRLQ